MHFRAERESPHVELHRRTDDAGRVEPIDPMVFEGRDPAWREWWEERLDAADRMQVEHAVRNATRVSDPRLEPFVWGLIAWSKRGLWLNVAVSIVLVATTSLEASLKPRWHGFWVTMFVVTTVLPWKVWKDARRLARAKDVQESRRGKRRGSA